MELTSQYGSEGHDSSKDDRVGKRSRFLEALGLFPETANLDAEEALEMDFEDENGDGDPDAGYRQHLPLRAPSPVVVIDDAAEMDQELPIVEPAAADLDAPGPTELEVAAEAQATAVQSLMAMEGIDLPAFEDLDSLPVAMTADGCGDGDSEMADTDLSECDDPRQLWLDETPETIFMEEADKPHIDTVAVPLRQETTAWSMDALAQLQAEAEAEALAHSMPEEQQDEQQEVASEMISSTESVSESESRTMADVPPPSLPLLPPTMSDPLLTEPESAGLRGAGVKLAPGWKPLRGKVTPKSDVAASSSSDKSEAVKLPSMRAPRQDSILDGFGQFLEETVVLSAANSGPDFMALDSENDDEPQTSMEMPEAKLEDAASATMATPASEEAIAIVPMIPPEVKAEWCGGAGLSENEEIQHGSVDNTGGGQIPPWGEAPSESPENTHDEEDDADPSLAERYAELREDQEVIDDHEQGRVDLLAADDDAWPQVANEVTVLVGSVVPLLSDESVEDDAGGAQSEGPDTVVEVEADADTEAAPDATAIDVLPDAGGVDELPEPEPSEPEVIHAPLLVDQGEAGQPRGFSADLLYGKAKGGSFFDELDKVAEPVDTDLAAAGNESDRDGGSSAAFSPTDLAALLSANKSSVVAPELLADADDADATAESQAEAEALVGSTMYPVVAEVEAEAGSPPESDLTDALDRQESVAPSPKHSTPIESGVSGDNEEESNPLLVQHGVSCPACGEGLRIQERYLTLAGKCPSCMEFIIARRLGGVQVLAELADEPVTCYSEQPDVEPQEVPGGTTLSGSGETQDDPAEEREHDELAASDPVPASLGLKRSVSDPFSNPNRALKRGDKAGSDLIWGGKHGKGLF